MNLDFIKAHWQIFEPWCKRELSTNLLPEGPELVEWWYRYCREYNAMLDKRWELDG